MPVRIFDNAPVNIEIGQKHPATLSERRRNAPTPTPKEKRRQQPHRGQRSGKEQRQPLTRARALIPGAVENSIKQYHIQPPPAEQKRAPKTPAGHPKQENTSAERRPPAGSTDRKKRAAARGGKRSHPAAHVPGRTADRRRPAAAAIPGPHAVTIQQTAAGADRGRPKLAKFPHKKRNARELARKNAFVCIIYSNTNESTHRQHAFLAKSLQKCRKRYRWAAGPEKCRQPMGP